MAAQTFITDLQAMNPGSVQVQQGASVVKAANSGSANQTAGKVGGTTIIQPAQTSSGQHFIVTTTVAEHPDTAQGEAVALHQGGQAVYPTQVQNNFQEYQQNAMYTSVAGAYYQTAPGTQVTATGLMPVQAMQGQIIQQSSGTFLIQGGTMDGEGTPLTHTTRASPATVQWLLDNYETAEGVSLPRSTLYYHYLRHCQEQNLDPMNPASFGKLIRSVFLGLRTRRLGTRGNSKYHYYGIRIKAASPLNQFTDEQTIPMRQQPIFHNKKPTKLEDGETDGSHQSSQSVGSQEAPTSQQQQHQMFLGNLGGIPKFGEINVSEEPLPDGLTISIVRTFEAMYREHAESIIDVVVNLQFPLIEALWTGFWRNQTNEIDNEYEKKLSREKLFALCQYEPVRKYVRKSDYAFYQAIVEVLIPDVLRPIPSSLTQAIRNFAKSLENWLRGAMQGVPDDMVKTKMGAVSAFAQTLRRYTSLNHLAQAARAVLQNTSQINQMLTDLNRVDFANVQEQASWVCQCEDSVVLQLQEDFKKTLKEQNNLEQWAIWLEGVVDQMLKVHEGSSYFPKAARQFLLKWSFYSSMVIRDLTLRSAASFGSFHLIRLLYDEYMFYLVEHKVACATGATPIAVMGEVRQFADLGNVVNLSTLEASSPPSSTTTTHLSSSSAPSASNSVPVMLVTNSSTSATGTTSVTNSATITVRPTTNGIAASTPSGRVGGGNTVVVLAQGSTTGAAGTASTMTGSQGNTITTFRNQSSSAGKGQPIQTILVMPAPMGDGPPSKRLKME